jgi:hypothetical protein
MNDWLEDHLAIIISLAVAAVISTVIAFYVAPFYFQTKLTPFGYSLIFVSVGAAIAGFLSTYLVNIALGIETGHSLSFLALEQEVFRGAVYFIILAAVAFVGTSVGLTLMPLK